MYAKLLMNVGTPESIGMQERLGISDMPMMPMGGMAMAPAAGGATAAEEKVPSVSREISRARALA